MDRDMQEIERHCRAIRDIFFGWEGSIEPDLPLRDAVGVLVVLLSSDSDGDVSLGRIEEVVSEAKEFAEGWIDEVLPLDKTADKYDAEALYSIVLNGGDAHERYIEVAPARRARVAVIVLTKLIDEGVEVDLVRNFMEAMHRPL